MAQHDHTPPQAAYTFTVQATIVSTPAAHTDRLEHHAGSPADLPQPRRADEAARRGWAIAGTRTMSGPKTARCTAVATPTKTRPAMTSSPTLYRRTTSR